MSARLLDIIKEEVERGESGTRDTLDEVLSFPGSSIERLDGAALRLAARLLLMQPEYAGQQALTDSHVSQPAAFPIY